MFDVHKSLAHLDGQVFNTGADLRLALLALCKKHVKELPIDFLPKDLYDLVRKNGWLYTVDNDKLKLIIAPYKEYWKRSS